MRRTRPLLAAVLATSMLVALPGSGQAAEIDYRVTVDTSATGPAISDHMYGVFFEDINRAADGGLYAELVQNRSFEYDRADNASYTPLTGWAPRSGDPRVVDDAGRLGRREGRGRRERPRSRHASRGWTWRAPSRTRSRRTR